MKTQKANANWVFLNIPYDAEFEQLLVAYVAGTCALGLLPRAALELPTNRNRLQRILELMSQCAISIHDLSRVDLDKKESLPRFNMPFELGLAVGRSVDSNWFVVEAERYRLQKTLSDLNGWEVLVHENSPEGVLRELLGTFTSGNAAPTMAQLLQVYESVSSRTVRIKKNRGVSLIVQTPGAFKDIVYWLSSSQRSSFGMRTLVPLLHLRHSV